MNDLHGAPPNRNNPSTASSTSNNQAGGDVSQMSENQFKESLEALLAGDNWTATSTTNPTTITLPIDVSALNTDNHSLAIDPVATSSAAYPQGFPHGIHQGAPSLTVSDANRFGTQKKPSAATGSAQTLTSPFDPKVFSSVLATAAPTEPTSFPISFAANSSGTSGVAVGASGHMMPNNFVPPTQMSVSFASTMPDMTNYAATNLNTKRPRSSASISEDEGERIRRRQDRNMREQQRSQQITQQIRNLKDILSSANVDFKNDKYSTLVAVGDYVKELQARSARLAEEHQGLLDTISKTSEVTNKPYVASDEKPSASIDEGTVAQSTDHDDSAVFVSGLDYKAVFVSCPVACALVSIDGRFLSFNLEFEQLCGFSKAELMPSTAEKEEEDRPSSAGTSPERSMSLFNILKRCDMENVFVSMSKMLKIPYPEAKKDPSLADEVDPDTDRWSGQVALTRNDQAKVSVFVRYFHPHVVLSAYLSNFCFAVILFARQFR